MDLAFFVLTIVLIVALNELIKSIKKKPPSTKSCGYFLHNQKLRTTVYTVYLFYI